jgi:RpiR family carbohydrate utilization transcriptional regulator
MLSQIETVLGELRQSERKVADLILSRPNDVVSLSIADLAKNAGVSQPTVMRFCQALGFGGFKEFKLRMAQSLGAGVPYVHREVRPEDSAANLVAKVFDYSIATLVQVRDQLDANALEKAITLLAHADRIELYGLGNSGIVALDAHHKFFRLGISAVAYADPHIHGMAASILRPGHVVIAISSSGRTRDLLRSIELARDAGAGVIGITASRSPLAKLCSVVLHADVEEDPDVYTPMSSRLAHLAIIDVLAVGVALARGPALIEKLEKTKRVMKEKRVRGFEEK